MLPLLLTNPGFRRSSITSDLRDPLALGPFWAGFENWSDAERAAAIAPVMNKLRPLLRPRPAGCPRPARARSFDISQVFTERKICWCRCKRGVIGPEAAGLLGSLVVAELWQAIRRAPRCRPKRRTRSWSTSTRSRTTCACRPTSAKPWPRPAATASASPWPTSSSASCRARCASAVLANARIRICFQLSHDDARHHGQGGHPELTPVDFEQPRPVRDLRQPVRPRPGHARTPPAATCRPAGHHRRARHVERRSRDATAGRSTRSRPASRRCSTTAADRRSRPDWSPPEAAMTATDSSRLRSPVRSRSVASTAIRPPSSAGRCTVDNGARKYYASAAL